MERIGSEIRGASRATTIPTIPAFAVWITVLLALGFTILTLSLVVGLRAGDSLSHPDPFAAYEGMWPGQSIESEADIIRRLPEVSLTCLTWAAADKFYPALAVSADSRTSQAPGEEIACTGFSKDKMFSSMSLALENGHVQVLHLVSNQLQQDALLLYWGAPDVIREARIAGHWALQWNRSTYQASALVQQATSVVDDVTLLAKE